MPRVNRFGFLIIALAFHLVYIYSIFDIYFVSPVVSGLRAHGLERPPGVAAPAQRLVLFVADGLRADKAFQSFAEPYPQTEEDLIPRPLAPFLRSRVLEHGTFGVSHTRVPTESRPGHVALIAGLYEDVSAVTTGWKLNPVNFDSVFNRSQHTWSWGSPDILPMFQLGAVPGRVDAFTYSAESEDFSKDAAQLDFWVFDGVKRLFHEAANNVTLKDQLWQSKIVFFLHLLGLDTNGHAYRPYSKEYLSNIKVVDEGVKEISNLIENFYKDNQTAFVFTADHGMSDWGSHGDGHPDNTRTPLIAWGSGVARPIVNQGKVASGHDELSSDWSLDHIPRNDVSQADIAALMAYLIGADFPANSVGQLPLNFLVGNMSDKSEAFLANTLGILDMYRAKEEQKKSTELRYSPFKAFSNINDTIDHRIATIKALIDQGRHEEAIRKTATLFKAGLEGLRYLQTYDWLFLRALITIGYLGWIVFALTIVIDLHVLHCKTEISRTTLGNIFFSSILVALYSSFFLSGSPHTYYAYAIFPVGFWEEIYARRDALSQCKKNLMGEFKTTTGYTALLVKTLIFLALLEALAQGYTHRKIFSLLSIGAIFWPAFYGPDFVATYKEPVATWVLSCTVLGSFTLFPAIKVENVALIMTGGLMMVGIGLAYLIFEDKLISNPHSVQSHKTSGKVFSRSLIGIQVGFIILAMIVTYSSVLSLQAKSGLPKGNQLVGWVVLTLSLATPLLHLLQPNNHYLHRLIVIFLTFSPAFVILTISYEGLFYVCFSITLLTWVRLEHAMYTFTEKKFTATTSSNFVPKLNPSPCYRSLTLADTRVSLFFFTLLQIAFFGTGNVASVSAFSLDSVYRLIPIFDPFSQGALLVLKLMIPFALISANLGILNKRLGVAPSALFMMVMAISDFLTLHFFWVVKDEGSWLEIGSSISHFCIASILCMFVAGLEGVSELFTAGVDVEDYESDATSGVAKEIISIKD